MRKGGVNMETRLPCRSVNHIASVPRIPHSVRVLICRRQLDISLNVCLLHIIKICPEWGRPETKATIHTTKSANQPLRLIWNDMHVCTLYLSVVPAECVKRPL